MKKSELVKRLQNEIQKSGDCHIRAFRIDEVEGWSQTTMGAPITKDKDGKDVFRKDRYGHRANMNFKEFVQYCKDNPIIKETKVIVDRSPIAEIGIIG